MQLFSITNINGIYYMLKRSTKEDKKRQEYDYIRQKHIKTWIQYSYYGT